MFANEDFIKASRKFVCIRIETFESKDTEEKVRALLNGAFANTAFCIFDPTGEERLTRSGRGPSQSLATRGRRGQQAESGDDVMIERMNRIAGNYQAVGKAEDAILQDFNSFRQALNVASADQRLLVLVDVGKVDVENDSRKQVESKLQKVFANDEIKGKFHLKFTNQETDKNWSKVIKGVTSKPAIHIVRSGTFGLEGTAMDQLPLSASADEIKQAMLKSNEKFASLEKRKTYSEHVKAGRRQRIYFENEIPYGEDRDGDGKVDNQRRGRRR